MFQLRTAKIAAIVILLSLFSSPIMGNTNNTAVDPVQAVQSNTVAVPKTSPLKDMSFDALRHETKVKASETRHWIKEQQAEHDYSHVVDSAAIAVDSFQDKVTPLGRSLKDSIKSNLPGKGLLQFGDRNVSVFGLMLMMAFALVLVLMGMSGPTSRLGGRH